MQVVCFNRHRGKGIILDPALPLSLNNEGAIIHIFIVLSISASTHVS
jgi:hypothetical protein